MYKLQSDGSIIREADGAIIPVDYGNRDYREFVAWLDEGNTISVPRILDTTDDTFGDDPWLF